MQKVQSLEAEIVCLKTEVRQSNRMAMIPNIIRCVCQNAYNDINIFFSFIVQRADLLDVQDSLLKIQDNLLKELDKIKEV